MFDRNSQIIKEPDFQRQVMFKAVKVFQKYNSDIRDSGHIYLFILQEDNGPH